MNASPNALVALSSELARAVATIATSVVYVDSHPRRDASGIVWDEHHVVTVDHAIEREDDIELLLGNGVGARATPVAIRRPISRCFTSIRRSSPRHAPISRRSASDTSSSRSAAMRMVPPPQASVS
jgi:hypothetical protein